MEDELKTHACPVCGFHYRDEATAKKCEAWCREHGSCSADITALSIERSGTMGSDPRGSDSKVPGLGEGCDDGVCTVPPRPSVTPAPPVPPAETGAQNLEKTQEEKCAELEANWKRALADYQNLQKEVARERVEMGAYAMLRAVERFLPIFDNFNVAMSHMPKSDDKAVVNWAVGIGFIQKQIEDALRDLGLIKIATVGEKFDASRHEAVGEVEGTVSDGEQGLSPTPGTILREVQAGYEINGKTVRPAKVIVSK